jgi:hypothetical protein
VLLHDLHVQQFGERMLHVAWWLAPRSESYARQAGHAAARPCRGPIAAFAQSRIPVQALSDPAATTREERK